MRKMIAPAAVFVAVFVAFVAYVQVYQALEQEATTQVQPQKKIAQDRSVDAMAWVVSGAGDNDYNGQPIEPQGKGGEEA